MEKINFDKPEEVDRKCADLIADKITERVNQNLKSKDIKV